MKEILKAASGALASGQRAALATIVSTSGSIPMSRRSKMLVLQDGTLRGTVGGGCLEAEIYARGRDGLVAGDGRPILSRFTLTEEEAGAEGLNCGGTVEILTENLAPGPVERVLAACLDVFDRREEAVLATSLEGRETNVAGKILLRRGGSECGSLGDAAMDAEARRLAAAVMGREAIGVETVAGGRRIFLETILVTPTVVLFGGGHVSREVARVAKTAGFRVVVVDDRPAFSSPERHPEADETLVLPMEGAFDRLQVDEHTYLLAITRGHQHDETIVRQALRTKAAYVGMIGSRRKVAVAKRNLAALGVAQADLDRLHAPIGLDIGADNPGEIAVSIVAELIAVRRKGGSASSLGRSGGVRR